jgi:hypothetical protein
MNRDHDRRANGDVSHVGGPDGPVRGRNKWICLFLLVILVHIWGTPFVLVYVLGHRNFYDLGLPDLVYWVSVPLLIVVAACLSAYGVALEIRQSRWGRATALAVLYGAILVAAWVRCALQYSVFLYH